MRTSNKSLNVYLSFAIINCILLAMCQRDPVTPPLNTPSSPTELICSVQSDSKVMLSWRDNAANEVGFIIERSMNDQHHFGAIDTVGLNITNYQDKGLLPGNYFYRIKAFNAESVSEPSNVIEVLISISKPLPPSELMAAAQAKGEILLSWRDNATNETGYFIERSLNDQDHFGTIDTLGSNATNFLDNGLLPGNYFYRISAYNSAGVSQPSNVAEIAMPTFTPAAPKSLSITTRGFFSLALAWDDMSDDETNYSLERSQADSLNFSRIFELSVNANAFEDTLLDPGTRYYYRVRCTNADGWSEYSNIASAFTRIPELVITPANSTLKIGGQITLKLEIIDPMISVFGISLRISFDQTLLEFDSSIPGSFFGKDVVYFVKPEEDIIYSTLSLKQGALPVYNSAGLMDITFQAIGAGNTEVNIIESNLTFFDSAGETIQMPFLRIRNSQIVVQ